MRLGLLVAPVAAAVAVVLASGCGSSYQVAASVAGVEYRVDDLHDYLVAIDPDRVVVPRSDVALWLQDWIFFTALELELTERGVTVAEIDDATALDTMSEFDPSFDPDRAGSEVLIHQQALRGVVMEWVRHQFPDAVVNDSEVEVPNYLCSNHILVGSAAEAEDVLVRLDAGEPFGELAAELSLDPGSGSSGGELGCAVEGSFVAEFEEAAYGAGADNVVVAESGFGHHVIEVLSAGPATAEHHPDVAAEELESVRELVFEQARSQVQAGIEGQRQMFLGQLTEDVFDRYADQVRVDRRYGEWDPELFRIFTQPAG